MNVTYTLAIRPKFRPGDVTCMGRSNVNLGDAAWVCDSAGEPAMLIMPTRVASSAPYRRE